MSWQLGAILVLGLALAGGFAWYERSRPDARIVALVATLAAFAALGRIAFAAVPNVKPTTDIVLLSGFALGPAPGFMVGAAAGLASNFFFGQGPWTPWQMVGWGLTGLIGAGVARATARRIGRWPLAIACMAVGFAFTVFQDVGDWVNFSDHSPAQLGVYVSKGLSFDAVHAGACLIFALAFGPALIRSLARFSLRLQVTWRTATPVILVALAVLLAPTGEAARAASDPVTYLLSAQNRDGGFGPAPGQPSTQLFSGWTALGLAAEGYDPSRVARGTRSLLDYLRAAAASNSDPGGTERSILVAAAAGADPRAFGGHDLVAALDAVTGRDGAVSDQTNLTAFAVLAWGAAGVPVPARSLAWLIGQQDSDGGFNYATAGAQSDVDDTGAVLEALAGDTSPRVGQARSRAVRYIMSQQNPDGGFPSAQGSPSNAQSTSWAIQGLIAAGVDPGSVHRAGAPSPLSYLSSLIAPDGHVRYSRSADQTPVWVTAQAAMALAGKALPISPPPSVQPAGAGTAGAAMRLATDAGALEALVLAPIGLG